MRKHNRRHLFERLMTNHRKVKLGEVTVPYFECFKSLFIEINHEEGSLV